MPRVKVKEEVTVAFEASLHTKHRPRRLDEVIGQREVVASIQMLFKSPTRPHAFCFVGPAGTGKTTLARIVGRMLEVRDDDMWEVDAATTSGVDDMKELLASLRYMGFGANQHKFIIIDECHALSSNAWKSMLKILEEPPAHVYFALCTTEIEKVPPTIRSRCVMYQLRDLPKDDLWDLLGSVVRAEKFTTPDDVLNMLLKYAEGSPRRMLTGLAAVYACADAKEAAVVLAQPFEREEIIELCRDMVGGRLTWDKVIAVLSACRDDDPESFRLIIVNYLNAVLLKSTTKNAPALLDLLSEFLRPFNRSEKMAPLLIAFGNITMPPLYTKKD